MSENMIILLINGSTLLSLLLFQILIPNISRRNILLGVRIPRDKMKTDRVKEIIKGFRRENLILGIIGIIFITLLLNKYNNVILMTLSPLLYLSMLFLIYIRWNKKIKELKSEKGWGKLAENVITVNTKFSRDKVKDIGISRKWYLIPLLIILGNIILSLISYSSLPDRVPTHWDFQGNIDGYMDKSILVALMMPMFQLIMLIIIYLTNHFVIISKQEIDGTNPEISLKRNIIFRRVWSINLLITLILSQIIFTVGNMMVLGLIEDIRVQNIISFGATAIIIIGAIITSIKVGQGGEKIKIDGDKDESMTYDIDDDSLWKLSNSIYYNPEDPSIIVEKRIGVGWTVNAGRPLGMFILILPFVIIIITFIITLFLVK